MIFGIFCHILPLTINALFSMGSRVISDFKSAKTREPIPENTESIQKTSLTFCSSRMLRRKIFFGKSSTKEMMIRR